MHWEDCRHLSSGVTLMLQGIRLDHPVVIDALAGGLAGGLPPTL